MTLRLSSLSALGVALLVLLPSARVARAGVEPASVAPGEVPGGAVVATVAGEAIDAAAIRRAMARQGIDELERLHGLDAKQAVVEELVRVRVLARAATEQGMDQDPEVREAMRQILADRWWRDLQASLHLPAVTDKEVAAYYESHADSFAEPLRLRGSILTLRRPVDETPALHAQAADLREQAAKSDAAAFAELVRRHSEDPETRRRGGDIGYVVEGASVFRVAPEVVDALFALNAPGGVSPLITTERAYHIVRLDDRQGGGQLPLPVVAQDIRRRLTEARREEHLAAEYGKVRARYAVAVDLELLARIGPRDLGSASRPPAFPVGDPAP